MTDALDSVSQMCDAGNTVVFGKYGGYVMGPGGRVDFDRVDDSYVRSTWVKRPKHKITKQKQDANINPLEKTENTATRDNKVSDPAFGRPGDKSL